MHGRLPFRPDRSSDDDGGEDRQRGPNWDQCDPDPWVPRVELKPAKEEAARQEHARGQQCRRGHADTAAVYLETANRGRQRDMNQPQQRAMRMGQGPHQTPRLVLHVQVGRNLESVQGFEDEPEQTEAGHRPPAEAEVAVRQLGVSLRSLFFTAQGAE